MKTYLFIICVELPWFLIMTPKTPNIRNKGKDLTKDKLIKVEKTSFRIIRSIYAVRLRVNLFTETP